MFEMCPENKLTERWITFLIKLTENDIGQNELFQILWLTWKDRKNVITSKYDPNVVSPVMRMQTQQLDWHQTLESDNPTLLSEILNLMVSGPRSRIRKLSAYLICILTYKNHIVQNKFWELLGFTPTSSVILLNWTLPSQLVSLPPSPFHPLTHSNLAQNLHFHSAKYT